MTMMWERSCEREAEVREMARQTARGQAAVSPVSDGSNDSDDAVLRDHIARCASCQETMAVATWMQELASAPVGNGPLPDPTYLWWKAELLRRWDAQQRAAAPIEVGEQVQVGVGLVAAAALLVWLWRNLPGLGPSATSLTMVTSLTMIMILSGALLAATAAVMVRDLMRGN